MSDTTLYEVLGVPETASAEEISTAYRHLVKITHPDAGGSDYLFRQVHEANAILSDPKKRAAYDREYAHQPTSNSEPADVPDEDVTADDGWTRVDDVPYGSQNRAPARVSFRDRLFGWDWRHRHYNATDAPHIRRRARDAIAQFFAKRPWIVVLFLAFMLAGALPKPAAILFLLAVVARLGSRRTARRRVARSVKPGQFDAHLPASLAALSLFSAQVVSGVVVLCLFICGPLRRHARNRRLHNKYQYRYWV